jgi:hypothetical protein
MVLRAVPEVQWSRRKCQFTSAYDGVVAAGLSDGATIALLVPLGRPGSRQRGAVLHATSSNFSIAAILPAAFVHLAH